MSKAFVRVPKPGHTLEFDKIRTYVGGQLAAFKVPRYWQQLEAADRARRRSVSPSTSCAKPATPRGDEVQTQREQALVTDYHTSIGTSGTRTRSRWLGADLARELMGNVELGELAFWLVAMAPPDAGGAAHVRGRPRRTRRPRLHPGRQSRRGSPSRVRRSRSRARSPAGILGGGSRVPRCHRGLRPIPRRRRSPGQRRRQSRASTGMGWLVAAISDAKANETIRVPGLGHPGAQGRGPADPSPHPGSRPRKAVAGPHLALFQAIGSVCIPRSSALHAPAQRRRRLRRGARRPRLRARHPPWLSRCSPAAPGCSGHIAEEIAAPARHDALPRRRAPRAGRLALVEGHLARLLVGGERSRRRVNAVVARAARHVGPDRARHVPLLERVERL